MFLNGKPKGNAMKRFNLTHAPPAGTSTHEAKAKTAATIGHININIGANYIDTGQLQGHRSNQDVDGMSVS